jgi:hypothetical protein
MKKIVYALAILAAASTASVAKDLKQDKKATTPAVSATQMTDAEMDKVTAGGIVPPAAVAYVSMIYGQVYVLVFNPGQAQVQYPGGTYVQVNPAF